MFSRRDEYKSAIQTADKIARETVTEKNDQSFISRMGGPSFDNRLILAFGERFTPEAYSRVQQIFPTVTDATRERHVKMSELVHDWNPQSNVFQQHYGSLFLGLSASFNAIYITNFFRLNFRLGTYARFAMYTSNVYMPTLCSGLFNEIAIRSKVIDTPDACVTCVGLKSGLVQALFATIYPLTFNALSAPYFAMKYFTYKLPHDMLASRKGTVDTLKEVWLIMCRRNKFFVKTMAMVFMANFVLGYYIAERQADEMYMIYETLLTKEEERLRQDPNAAKRASGQIVRHI